MSKKQKIIFILVFLFCLFTQILPVFRNGILYDYGIGFWGSNGHDAIWHLSLINHITNPFKINLPIYSGEILKNYHPFYDILISFLSKISFIDSSVWYFQIFPILSSVVLLFTSFLIGKKITSKFSGGLLLMFLNSFANSFGWLITLIKSGQIGGESLFWAMQSPSNQLNPPFVLSLIFINFLLLLLLKKSPKTLFQKITIVLLLTLTPITKAYGGVVIYLILGFYSLINFKKDKSFFKLLLISLPISYLVFSLYNSSSSSLFIFQPLWFINSLIESPDRLYIPILANMRYTLEASGKIGPRLIFVYGISIGFFYLGNFAWRIFGVLSLKSFKEKIKFPLLLTIILTSLIPLFFIQKGTSWNTIQFLYYSLFLSNIFLCFYLSSNKNILIKIILGLVITTSIISSTESYQRYLSNPAPASLPTKEIEALKYLKSQPSGYVLVFPYNKYQKQNMSTPIPLYAYETTAYVSAFSQKQVFIEDEMNLDITGFDWETRRQLVDKFFSTSDKYFGRGVLVDNNIRYIYLLENQKLSLSEDDLQIDKIYDQNGVKIYQVRR